MQRNRALEELRTSLRSAEFDESGTALEESCTVGVLSAREKSVKGAKTAVDPRGSWAKLVSNSSDSKPDEMNGQTMPCSDSYFLSRFRSHDGPGRERWKRKTEQGG